MDPCVEVLTVEVRDATPHIDPAEQLRDRILAALRTPRYRRGAWQGHWGWRPWWSVRAAVGGRVRTETFRRAVEELLAAGEIIEAWLEPRDQRPRPHILLLPGAFGELDRPVSGVRGREDVLRSKGFDC